MVLSAASLVSLKKGNAVTLLGPEGQLDGQTGTWWQHVIVQITMQARCVLVADAEQDPPDNALDVTLARGMSNNTHSSNKLHTYRNMQAQFAYPLQAPPPTALRQEVDAGPTVSPLANR